MESTGKEKIAQFVKAARVSKGYTQQALSEITGISLRSIQRIENAEVAPRAYTLRLLAERLEISLDLLQDDKVTAETAGGQPTAPALTAPKRTNKAQKWILTFSSAMAVTLLVGAYIAQSPSFPETQFELFLLLAGVIGFYAVVLLAIWR